MRIAKKRGNKSFSRTGICLALATAVAVVWKEVRNDPMTAGRLLRAISESLQVTEYTRYSRRDTDPTFIYQDGTPPTMKELAVYAADSPLDLSVVKRVDRYGTMSPPLFFAQWNHPAEIDKQLEPGNTMLAVFQQLVCPGSVAIDIGAHGGDTTLALAGIVGTDGLVISFEPGPPYSVLQVNTHINAAYKIDAYNFAIDATEGEWCYLSGCDGCNGRKSPCNSDAMADGAVKLRSHRLDNVLMRNYDEPIRKRISFIKIDAEGYDADVVNSLQELLHSTPVRPVIQVEWFAPHQRTICSDGTKKMFAAARTIDYNVYSIVFSKAGTPPRFEWKRTCEDLKPGSSSTGDLILFPKEVKPRHNAMGRRSQDCPAVT